MGPGASAILAYADRVSAAKCLTGSYALCIELADHNPRLRTVARSLSTEYGLVDCPEPWMYEDPAIWWSAIRDHLPAGFDYYEVQNECGVPPGADGYAKWAQWSIAIAERVAAEKNGALLAFSFATGTPELTDWIDLIPYLEWAAQHPLPDGRYHGIAFHAAPYAPWSRADSPWVNDPWLAGRHALWANVLRAHGFDLSSSPVTVAVTEVGVTGGYSGNWAARYTPQEKAAAYRATRDAYALSFVDLFMWWNLGTIAQWEDDSAALPLIW